MPDRKAHRRSTFLDRRRSRQGQDDVARSSAYTFDLAALYLKLLVAMAAADENVRMAEEDVVLSFIDRTLLRATDIERLEQVARASLRNPPGLDELFEQLAPLARKPAIARQVVADLAHVAAADAREDPRETAMLERVCDELGVERVHIEIDHPSPIEPDVTPPPRPLRSAAAQVVNRYRIRMAVRRALESNDHERR